MKSVPYKKEIKHSNKILLQFFFNLFYLPVSSLIFHNGNDNQNIILDIFLLIQVIVMSLN